VRTSDGAHGGLSSRVGSDVSDDGLLAVEVSAHIADDRRTAHHDDHTQP
jgi:hypothetical protein